MSPPPISIDGTDITGATIDGTEVTEITVDGETVFTALPSSGLLHDFNAQNVAVNDGNLVSEIPDAETQVVLNGSGTMQEAGINGIKSIILDGVDDSFSESSTTRNQPLAIFTVLDANDSGDLAAVLSSSTTRFHAYLDYRANFDSYLDAGIFVNGSPPPTGTMIYSAIFDGPSSSARINATTLASGDAGNNNLDGISIGSREANSDRFLDGLWSRTLIYDLDQLTADSSISEVETKLNDKYAIF
jgi:hypothetical protein